MSKYNAKATALISCLILGLSGCGGSGGGGGTTTTTTAPTATINVSPVSPTSTTEAGTTATFSVNLGSAPSANVDVPIASDTPTEGSVSVTSLTFTPGNYSIAQTVTVTGVNDLIVDGDQTYHITVGPATSSDAGYNGLSGTSLTLINQDVPTGSLVLTPSGDTDESGQSTTFTVKLDAAPADTVTVTLASNDSTEGDVSPTTLLLDNTNYNSNTNIITITGKADGIPDGNQIYAIELTSACAGDSNYDGLTDSVSLTNIDLVDPYAVTPKVSAGSTHNLVLANDGTVWGWGRNNAGQLDVPGVSDPTSIPLPRQLDVGKAADIAAGYEFSAIVKNDGTVWTSGVNIFSQLGHHAGTTPYMTLAQVPITGIEQVAAGATHVLTVKNDGTVWAWGHNSAGQLGADTGGADSATPVQAQGLTGVTAINAGQDHSMALSGTSVYTWGSDANGQLGDGGTNTDRTTPTAIVPANLLVSTSPIIAAGQRHSFAVGTYGGTTDSMAWGQNATLNRQLGTTSAGDKTVPTEVVGSITDAVTKLSGGNAHSLAILGGVVYGWGDNDDASLTGDDFDNRGVLGNGNSTADVVTPATNLFATEAIDLSAGRNHSLVLLNDGQMQTSGKSSDYQLGNTTITVGSDNFTATPVMVMDPDGINTFYAYRPILAGYPSSSTTIDSTSIDVCPTPTDCGGITGYAYSTNNWATSATDVIANPINLTGLSGTVNLQVKGMVGASEIQSNDSAVSVTWTVN